MNSQCAGFIEESAGGEIHSRGTSHIQCKLVRLYTYEMRINISEVLSRLLTGSFDLAANSGTD